jgi:hypothetical protein
MDFADDFADDFGFGGADDAVRAAPSRGNDRLAVLEQHVFV